MPTFTNPCLTHWVPGFRGSHSFVPTAGAAKFLAANWPALAGPLACAELARVFARVDVVVCLAALAGADVSWDPPPQPTARAAEHSAVDTTAATPARLLHVPITRAEVASAR